MSRIQPIVIFLVVVFMSGCFEAEQSLMIEKDLSGKAGVRIRVDMEPMVLIMAQLKHDLDKRRGPLTQAEIRRAKKEFLAGKTSSPMDKAELISKLPAGVTLLSSNAQDAGMRFSVDLLFGFDHISKLKQIVLPSRNTAPATKTSSPVDTTFTGLTVTDVGDNLLVTMDVQEPVDTPEKGPTGSGPSPAMTKLFNKLVNGMKVSTKIDTPLEVLEHNATRREGNTLVWEFSAEAFAKMTPQQRAGGIRVRLKK